MYKKTGTALRAHTLCVNNDILCVIALREVGAGNELTVSSFLINELTATLGADFTGLFRLESDLIDGFLCCLDLCIEFRIELSQDLLPVFLAFFNIIKLCFHISRK